MSRIVMAVIGIMALSLISVSLIQDYVIDWAKESKDQVMVEPQRSANPPNESNAANAAGNAANSEGQAAADDGFIE